MHENITLVTISLQLYSLYIHVHCHQILTIYYTFLLTYIGREISSTTICIDIFQIQIQKYKSGPIKFNQVVFTMFQTLQAAKRWCGDGGMLMQVTIVELCMFHYMHTRTYVYIHRYMCFLLLLISVRLRPNYHYLLKAPSTKYR